MALKIEVTTDLDNIEETHLAEALQLLEAEHLSGGEWRHSTAKPDEFRAALRIKLTEVAGSKGEQFVDDLAKKVKIETYRPPPRF